MAGENYNVTVRSGGDEITVSVPPGKTVKWLRDAQGINGLVFSNGRALADNEPVPAGEVAAVPAAQRLGY